MLNQRQSKYVWITVLWATAMLLLAACGGGGSKLPDDPREAVVQAMKAQLKATPFRVTDGHRQ